MLIRYPVSTLYQHFRETDMPPQLLWKYMAMLLLSTSSCLTILPSIAAAKDSMPSLIAGNSIHFTALKCTQFEGSFLSFTRCQLKPINRMQKLMSVHVHLHRSPLTAVKAQLTFWKKANGYKPFVINVTLDACRYLSGQKNAALDWIYDVALPYTNINHSCPFTTDLILDSLPLMAIKLPSLFPEGEYRADLKTRTFGTWSNLVSLYGTVTEHIKS